MTLPERISSTLAPSAAGRLGPLEDLHARLARIGPGELLDAAREHGVLGSVYKPFTNLPEKRVPLVELHAGAAALAKALEEGEFGAWDAALDMLAALADPETDRLAGAVFAANYTVWPEIGERAKAILLRSPSDAALAGLLAGLAAGVPSRFDVATHPHPQLGKKLHEALRESGAATFQPFSWPTVDTWDAMSEAERRDFDRGREEAAKAAGGTPYARALIVALQRLAYLPALGDLLAMAVGHPVLGLRQAALTSLLGFTDEAAKDALRAAASDAKVFFTGVFHIVRREPERAFDLLSPRLSAEGLKTACARQVASAVVSALRDDAEESARRPEGADRSCLRRDPRWLDVAAAREDEEGLGAATLLRFFDKKEVAVARKRARAARKPPTVQAPADRVARYKAGEHEQVWQELFDAGDLGADPALREEALAVARETMSRVRRNIDLLAERLNKLGYRPPQPLATPPDAGQLAAVVEGFGPLPLSVFAFYEVLGSVSFAWDDEVHEKPTKTLELLSRSEPLVVGTVAGGVSHLGAPPAVRNDDPEEPFTLWVAPDASGGPPLHFRLPSRAAEAVLHGERHRLPFVAYLRLCMKWGGFPGLERAAKKPRALLTRLTRDLLPF